MLPRRHRNANRNWVSTIVPNCPSQARPCPARSCWTDNSRRVVGDASRALILYDAATGPKQGKFITVHGSCLVVSCCAALPLGMSVYVYREVSPGVETEVAKWMCRYRENVGARETFRVKRFPPSVHLHLPSVRKNCSMVTSDAGGVYE